MEIEVEAGRPEDSRIYRASAKRSGEKPRKTKHRSLSSNHNGSAEGSRRADTSPKIFRLLRSRGRLSDYKTKLSQYMSGIISRNVFCTFLTNTLSKSEIEQHNKFILGILRNDRRSNDEEEKSRDGSRRSRHRSSRERSAQEGSIPERTADVTKDRDGFTVPPPIPEKKKHGSRRDEDRRHAKADLKRSAQDENPSSPPIGSSQGSHQATPGPLSAESALPADLTNYLQGLDEAALEHLLRETSMISEHLKASSAAIPSEQSRSLAPQCSADVASCKPTTPANDASSRSSQLGRSEVTGAPDVPGRSAFATPDEFQARLLYSNPSVRPYEPPEAVGVPSGHFVQTVPVAYEVQDGHANFGPPYFSHPLPEPSFQQPPESGFAANLPGSALGTLPHDSGGNTAASSGFGTAPEVDEGFPKPTDSSESNLWWPTIVDPAVFQRGYDVLNGADGTNCEGSAMWAQQFLQTNEHENDYIYSSKA